MFGKGGITTGARNDIEQATRTARKMVCEWGMSEKLGPLQYGQKEEPIFIGKEIARHKDYSERTAEMIDEDIREIVENAYKRAWDILTKNRKVIDKLARHLLEREVLDRKAIEEITGIKKSEDTKKTRTVASKSEKENNKKAKASTKKLKLRTIKIATNEAGGE
ncbi:ATP-dependent zinc metalloprotease FtsH [subsurface metagenome]